MVRGTDNDYGSGKMYITLAVILATSQYFFQHKSFKRFFSVFHMTINCYHLFLYNFFFLLLFEFYITQCLLINVPTNFFLKIFLWGFLLCCELNVLAYDDDNWCNNINSWRRRITNATKSYPDIRKGKKIATDRPSVQRMYITNNHPANQQPMNANEEGIKRQKNLHINLYSNKMA